MVIASSWDFKIARFWGLESLLLSSGGRDEMCPCRDRLTGFTMGQPRCWGHESRRRPARHTLHACTRPTSTHSTDQVVVEEMLKAHLMPLIESRLQATYRHCGCTFRLHSMLRAQT
jgi:hypothetical protein